MLEVAQPYGDSLLKSKKDCSFEARAFKAFLTSKKDGEKNVFQNVGASHVPISQSMAVGSAAVDPET